MENLSRLTATPVLTCLAASVADRGPKTPRGPAVSMPPAPQLTDADMPHPKAGLCSVHSAVVGDSQTCLSGQTLRYFSLPAVCTQNSRQHSADGSVVMDSRCRDSSHTTTAAHGDFQTAFSIDLIGSASGSGPLSKLSDHLDYKYLGACAAGQKPDDVA
jgi:hypothetical protein